MPPRVRKTKLYEDTGPAIEFNKKVIKWLNGSIKVREHSTPAAFSSLLEAYIGHFNNLSDQLSKKDKHLLLLNQITNIMMNIDLSEELSSRLSPELINTTGFRTTLAQGAAKNNGENFVNIIVYIIADLLKDQDEILIDKGLCKDLKDALTLKKSANVLGNNLDITIPIEGDFCIFSRTNPRKAIVASLKTRLKEVFHVGTMWKLFFDMLNDNRSLQKWGLERMSHTGNEDLTYIFITADMVPSTGRNSQGPDVEREMPRNLIAMDASFFDYVFVSKENIPHVASQLAYESARESLFHELKCLISLIEQKFRVQL